VLCQQPMSYGCSREHTLNLARRDIVRDVLRGAAINLAPDRVGSSEDLLDGSLKLASQGLESHDSGNLNDLIERDRFGVLDVLLLFAVPRGLFEGLDDEGGCGGNDGDSGLTVLNGEFDGDTETFLYFTESIRVSLPPPRD